MVRWAFDKATGYGPNMTEKLWLRRIIYLETVAGAMPFLYPDREGELRWALLAAHLLRTSG